MDGSFATLIADVIDFVIFILPIALPIAMLIVAFDVYLDYRRKNYMNSIEWVLLEIIPPADVTRSPAAMEVFMIALHQTSGESRWWDRNILGKFRTWFSLELISTGGKIQYFIRADVKQRVSIESNLYAQFPGIEVTEAKEDYTDGFYFDDEKFEMFAAELEFVKEDPYPIKTYLDYELDKEKEPEFKVDPMAPVFEYLHTVKPNNHIWFQIIVRAHKKEDLDFSKTFPTFAKRIDKWEVEGRSQIEDLRMKSFVDVEEGKGDNMVIKKMNQQTTGQKELIEALERSLSKYSFDSGIRCLAIAPKDEFDKGNKGMLGVWKQYSSLSLNGFKPGVDTDFDWWWQDPFGNRLKKMKKEMLEAYKTRNYFWKSDYKGKSRKKLVLNTEELATIYHFPGRVSETPTVQRVDARKAAPPTNLPM